MSCGIALPASHSALIMSGMPFYILRKTGRAVVLWRRIILPKGNSLAGLVSSIVWRWGRCDECWFSRSASKVVCVTSWRLRVVPMLRRQGGRGLEVFSVCGC